MKVWSGSISLDSEFLLTGISLVAPPPNAPSPIFRSSTLRFRSYVNPALIPLYARAGPNLELHSTDYGTSQWLKNRFLSAIWLGEDALETFLQQSFQCPVGMLVQVTGSEREKTSAAISISDLLIYGVLSTVRSFERPPTPPEAFTSDCGQRPVLKYELRIYAAPLSASLIGKVRAQAAPPSLNFDDDGPFAEFLADPRSPSPRRKRVAALFEEAALHHRRVHQRGGAAVSQLMAHSGSQSFSQLQLHPPKAIKQELEEAGSSALERLPLPSQRSRSLSVGPNFNSNGKLLEHHRLEHSRSRTSHGFTTRASTAKRDTPSRALDAIDGRSQTPILTPLDGKAEMSSSDRDSKIIVAENKNLMVRTILTCMRLYGFKRTVAAKPQNTSTAQPAPEDKSLDIKEELAHAVNESASATISSNVSDEDGFKAMYHATYRAATFALRKYFKTRDAIGDSQLDLPPLLAQEKATTTVDELLRLFCEEN